MVMWTIALPIRAIFMPEYQFVSFVSLAIRNVTSFLFPSNFLIYQCVGPPSDLLTAKMRR